MVYNNAPLIRQVVIYFETPGRTDQKQDILRLMKSFQENLGYQSIFLINAKGIVRFSVSVQVILLVRMHETLLKEALLIVKLFFLIYINQKLFHLFISI